MVCKKCGAECLDNAKFCGSCGARIDGKIACKSCGELNDEGTLFCVQCGAQMDGKKACLYCGTAYAGNFCTECGRGAEPTVEEEVVTTSVRYITPTKPQGVETTARKWSIAKILDISAGALSMIAVLCALIFVFFIGVAPDVAGTLSKKQTNTIFYYFGDYQKSIASIMKLGSNDAEELGYSLWFLKQIQASTSAIGTFGLIVGILALVTVLTTATGAITVFVRNCLGYSEKKADKWAIACVISFFVFAFAFLSLHTVVVEGLEELARQFGVSENEVEEEIFEEIGLLGVLGLFGSGKMIAFSGATKAGIVLCAVFLGLFVLCKLLASGKKLFTLKTLALSLVACLGAGFASVVMSLMKSAGASIELFADSVELGLTFSPILANTVCNSMFAVTSDYVGYTSLTKALETMSVFNCLAQIMLLFTLIFAGLTVCANLNGITQKENGYAISWAVMSLICSILFLVFSIISYGQLQTAFEIFEGEEISEYMSPNYTKQICAVVFSALSLVTSIVFNVLKEKDKKPDNKWNLRSYY